jgi:glycosyltransferase involved in cell wall biosynthesis
VELSPNSTKRSVQCELGLPYDNCNVNLWHYPDTLRKDRQDLLDLWLLIEAGCMTNRKSLSIAVFPEYFYPHVGGAEVWTANIVKYLAEAGHHVEVFTYRMPGATSGQVLFGVKVHRMGKPFVIGGARPYFKRILIHSACSFLIIMKKTSRFDVIVAQYSPLLALKPVSRVRRIPIVAIFHDVYGLESSIQGKGILRGLIRYIFGDLLITRLPYDAIVAVSDATKRKLARIKCATHNVHIVRNAVDTTLIDAEQIDRVPKRICYVGRLLPHKHVDDLLNAFAKVRAKESDARLLIIGDGEERNSLVSTAEKLGIADSVRFTGVVGDAEKFRLMKSCELLVLPSTDEGWGIVVTEAIACGLSTICYDIPALREQARFFPSMQLVPARDVVSLYHAILHTISHPDRERIEVDSKLVRSDFNWQRRAEELADFLRTIVTNRTLTAI